MAAHTIHSVHAQYYAHPLHNTSSSPGPRYTRLETTLVGRDKAPKHQTYHFHGKHMRATQHPSHEAAHDFMTKKGYKAVGEPQTLYTHHDNDRN